MYEYVDEVLKKLVRALQLLFRQYRQMKFDELNVLEKTSELYQRAESLNWEAFFSIFRFYYWREYGDEKVEMPSDGVVEAWLADVLHTPSQVMKYAYDSEITRKRDRLIESLNATHGNPQEIDKALRYWVQMAGWFAVEVADAAVKQAREDMSIDLVMWLSERDGHVCKDCSALDGQIFHMRGLPPKPHPNCRCYTVVVKG